MAITTRNTDTSETVIPANGRPGPRRLLLLALAFGLAGVAPSVVDAAIHLNEQPDRWIAAWHTAGATAAVALFGLAIVWGAWRHNAYLSAVPALYLAISFAAWTTDRPMASTYVAPEPVHDAPIRVKVDRNLA